MSHNRKIHKARRSRPSSLPFSCLLLPLRLCLPGTQSWRNHTIVYLLFGSAGFSDNQCRRRHPELTSLWTSIYLPFVLDLCQLTLPLVAVLRTFSNIKTETCQLQAVDSRCLRQLQMRLSCTWNATRRNWCWTWKPDRKPHRYDWQNMRSVTSKKLPSILSDLWHHLSRIIGSVTCRRLQSSNSKVVWSLEL